MPDEKQKQQEMMEPEANPSKEVDAGPKVIESSLTAEQRDEVAHIAQAVVNQVIAKLRAGGALGVKYKYPERPGTWGTRQKQAAAEAKSN